MPDSHGPYHNARFLLEIDDIVRAGFSSCTIPENSTESVEYREGTDPPTMRKLWGLNDYGTLTLESGVTDDSIELFEWRQLVERGELDDARRSIAVVVLDEEGNPGPRWEFRKAWPTNYDAPELDASGSDVAVESLEIEHEGMERVE